MRSTAITGPPNTVSKWRGKPVDHIPDAFSAKRYRENGNDEEFRSRLYQEICQLKVDVD